MGHRLLYLSHASGRVGAFPPRSARVRIKFGFFPSPARRRFAIFRLRSDTFSPFSLYWLPLLARYPRGLRERSAKPPFVGSNPTRASKIHSATLPCWLNETFRNTGSGRSLAAPRLSASRPFCTWQRQPRRVRSDTCAFQIPGTSPAECALTDWLRAGVWCDGILSPE